MVSSSFSYTCILIHTTIVLLLIGIYQVLINFSNLLHGMGEIETGSADALAQLPTFQMLQDGSEAMQLLSMMVTSMLITLTFVNAAAVKIVEGGHNFKFLFYIGITLIVSGLSTLLLPDLMSGIFSSIAAPVE